jgi:hypothetical protein
MNDVQALDEKETEYELESKEYRALWSPNASKKSKYAVFIIFIGDKAACESKDLEISDYTQNTALRSNYI